MSNGKKYTKPVAQIKALKKETKSKEFELDKLNGKFDTLSKELAAKFYDVELNSDSMQVINDILEKTIWSAGESFALKLCYEGVNSSWAVKLNTDALNSRTSEPVKLSSDVLETLWSFVIRYKGLGYTEAKRYVMVADVLSKKVVELNDDRQVLKDLATEINELESKPIEPKSFDIPQESSKVEEECSEIVEVE